MTTSDPIRNIAFHIPGYGGYLQRETRRETDKLIRLRILSGVSHASRRVDELARRIYSIRESEEVYRIADRVRWKTQLLETYIRGLEYGYAPMFSVAKVDQDKLDAIIRYDENLILSSEHLRRQSDELSEHIDGLDQVREGLGKLEDLANEIENQVQRRQELFLQ